MMRSVGPKGPRWAWCDTCRCWVGSTPPVLPPYWPNEKAAAMHKSGMGHRARILTPTEVFGHA